MISVLPMPFATQVMLSVTMIGGRFSPVIIIPFRKPMHVVAARASAAPSSVTPAGDGESCMAFMTLAITTVERPACAPTERSMPPVRITKVIPMASMDI